MLSLPAASRSLRVVSASGSCSAAKNVPGWHRRLQEREGGVALPDLDAELVGLVCIGAAEFALCLQVFVDGEARAARRPSRHASVAAVLPSLRPASRGWRRAADKALPACSACPLPTPPWCAAKMARRRRLGRRLQPAVAPSRAAPVREQRRHTRERPRRSSRSSDRADGTCDVLRVSSARSASSYNVRREPSPSSSADQ